MQLTAQFIEQVTPPDPGPGGKSRQVFYRDSTLVGFGLRVASGGTKSYILERRIRGKVKRISLGRCEHIEFKRAKSRAIKFIEEIERENAPRIIYGKIIDKNISLQNAFKEYLLAHPKLSRVTLEDYHRSIRGPLQDWLSTPIRQLTEDNILAKHKLYQSQGQARCNNAMRLLAAILNHAKLHFITHSHKAIIKANPVDVLSRQRLWYIHHKHKNQGYIKPEQLKNWWQATLQLRKTSTRDYLQFLLLTGLPHIIASMFTFEHVDFENKTLKIKTENGGLLVLPLTNYLNDMIRVRARRNPHTQGYLFPGLTSEKPISDPRASIKRVQKLSKVNFTLNDLHRTFMYIAGKSANNQSTLDVISTLFRQKYAVMPEENIKLMRELQEDVFATIAEVT